jgi:hypothetical protein
VLYEQMRLTEAATYSSPVRVRVEWATPLAKRYADMIQKLDDLLRLVNTLWLHDALPSVQNRVYSWQQRFMRLAGRLRALAGLVRHQISKSRDLRPHEIELSEHLRNAIEKALSSDDTHQADIPVDAEDLRTSTKAMAVAAKLITQEAVPGEESAKPGKKTKSKAAAAA